MVKFREGKRVRIFYLSFLLSLFIFTIAFAAAEDMRISDESGDVLNLTSSGTLTISTTNDNTTVSAGGAQDVRISDNDGDVLNITNRALTLVITG